MAAAGDDRLQRLRGREPPALRSGAPGAEMLAGTCWRSARSPPNSPFVRGRVPVASISGPWLERGTIAADDALLPDSPLGLAGQRDRHAQWFAAASRWCRHAARACSMWRAPPAVPTMRWAHRLAPRHPATLPSCLRVLALRVEPLMDLFQDVCASAGAPRSGAWMRCRRASGRSDRTPPPPCGRRLVPPQARPLNEHS